ncbi:MAG: VOC family protein [Pseudomonadota bacterium]|nr:VOC family protein [Pseudomonadota bacterium]
MQTEQDQRVDYLEFSVPDVASATRFFSDVFGWVFSDYGPDYQSFSDGRLTGGFATGPAPSPGGGVLVILYATDLAATEARVVANGGTIVRPVFAFPGGRRFHFREPNGIELAVWSLPLREE